MSALDACDQGWIADLPTPGVEPGEPCEAGCGARVFTATAFGGDRHGQPGLIETVPGRPMRFGDEHTAARCRELRAAEQAERETHPHAEGS